MLHALARLLLLSLLLLQSAIAFALEKSVSYHTLLELYETNIDVFVFLYDETVTDNREAVMVRRQTLSDTVPVLIEAVQLDDPEKAVEMRGAWKALRATLERFERYGHEERALVQFEATLSPMLAYLYQKVAAQPLSLEEKANLAIHHVLSLYVQQTATPADFTGTSAGEMDIGEMANTLDAQLAQMKDKYKDTELERHVRQIKFRWDFMRAQLAQPKARPVPFLAARYSREIFSEFDAFMPGKR